MHKPRNASEVQVPDNLERSQEKVINKSDQKREIPKAECAEFFSGIVKRKHRTFYPYVNGVTPRKWEALKAGMPEKAQTDISNP